MAAASASSGVLNTTAANPRWLPDAERVRKVLRSTTTAHRLDADEQRSLLKLLDTYEIDANDNGAVIFTQPQQCYCYDTTDVEEQQLALQRQQRTCQRQLELLRIQLKAFSDDSNGALDVHARIEQSEADLARLTQELEQLAAPVRALCE
jgi:hypothetical protein